MQYVLFDLDGTLADAREGIVKCIEHAFHELGEAIPSPPQLADCLGPPLWESFGKYLRNPDEDRIKCAIAAYRERFNDVGMFENRLYPGVVDVLSELSGRGFSLYVVTSKPRIPATAIVEHFGISSFFREIHGPELSDYSSSKGDLIAEVLARHQLQPHTGAMIGDRRHDVVGALANGVCAVGACWGYGDTSELVEAGAHFVVESLKDLLDVPIFSAKTP